MRSTAFCFGLAALLATLPALAENAATAQPPTTSAANLLPPLLQLPAWPIAKTASSALSQLDAEAFLPKTTWWKIPQIPRPDTRTPAQLAAMLAAYVGTWRGEAVTTFLSGQASARYSVALVYKLEQDHGRSVLVCDGTYLLPSGPLAMRERAWVENGRIVAELEQGTRKQSFAANSNGNNLVWYSTGPVLALLEFCQVETLRLTVDGGTLHSDGFDVEHGPNGAIEMTGQTVDLKLVKP